IAGVVSGRADDDAAAAHALADIVVRFADELELDAGGEEGPEALPGAALEARPHSPGWHAGAEPLRDEPTEARPDRSIVGADRIQGLDDARSLERRQRFAGEPLTELSALGS